MPSSEIQTLQRMCREGGDGPVQWLAAAHEAVASLDRSGPCLNAVLEWNHEAEGIAAALGRELELTGPRGPLHGVPVLLKDNIGTGDGMHTSAGSLALASRFAPEDAFVAARLRAAGAVLCGKANMTELANYMAEDMPNGYSSRGGQVLSPWKAGADPSGSSTGCAVAVAAGYVTAAIGTETCGSIISPSAACGVVGLKPTVGWVSRAGILPIAPSQDVAGPIARTVADCALVFAAIAGHDPEDPSTGMALGRAVPGCPVGGRDLKGVRLGVYPLDEQDRPFRLPAFDAALAALEALGAELVPWQPPKGSAEGMGTVLQHEFAPAMDAALRRDTSGIRTLAGIAAFNEAHADACLRYGQETVLRALRVPRPMLTREYFDARQKARDALRLLTQGFRELRLDAVVSKCGLIAFPVTGCPALTLPAGTDAETGLPVPVTFNGLPFSEGSLLAFGAALESALDARVRLPAT